MPKKLNKDEHMAASTVGTIHGNTAAVQHAAPVGAQATERRNLQGRRRVTPETKRALAMLGHAIEYLEDEYLYEGGQFNLADAQVQAVAMLMERNREIYSACPVVPSLGDRFRKLIRPRLAA
jgi:hypothetical protein